MKTKRLIIIPFIALILSNTAVYAQIEVKLETRKLLVPKPDSLEKFLQFNKIDYALITYSTSNWIALDYIFYAMVKKKRSYYLIRLANLDVYAKKPILKINQKKLKKLQAQEYLNKIAPAVAFKFTNQDYGKLPQYCTVIHETDTVYVDAIYDVNSLHIFEYAKNTKRHIEAYNPFYYFENCYPYNPEYDILKGFVNTYDELTDLVKKAFEDDVILPIQKRPRNE